MTIAKAVLDVQMQKGLCLTNGSMINWIYLERWRCFKTVDIDVHRQMDKGLSFFCIYLSSSDCLLSVEGNVILSLYIIIGSIMYNMIFICISFWYQWAVG